MAGQRKRESLTLACCLVEALTQRFDGGLVLSRIRNVLHRVRQHTPGVIT